MKNKNIFICKAKQTMTHWKKTELCIVNKTQVFVIFRRLQVSKYFKQVHVHS